MGHYSMRILLIILMLLAMPGLGTGQQTRLGKVLTPEQRAMQEHMRELDTERQRLRATAKAAFDAEMAREKSGDCPDARNTYEFNVCFGEQAGIANQNLKTYESAIHDLLGLKYPDREGPQVAEFDRLEQLWHAYLNAAATGAFHQFEGGTGGPSFEMETHLRLVRSHMRELDTLYGMALRL